MSSVSVLWWGQKPDWKLLRCQFEFKKLFSCSFIKNTKENSNSKQAKTLKETELHCLASHWLMRVWSCVVCCESSLSSSESIRESTLVSGHESCDVILLMFNDENLQHRFSWKHRKTLSVQTLDMFQWSTLCWMNGNVSYVFLLLLVLMSFIHAGLTQGTVLYCSIFDLLNKCELCISLFVYMDHMRIPHLSLCWWFMSIFCCHSPSPRIICLCSSSCC